MRVVLASKSEAEDTTTRLKDACRRAALPAQVSRIGYNTTTKLNHLEDRAP